MAQPPRRNVMELPVTLLVALFVKMMVSFDEKLPKKVMK
jgi:hypothetical protein